MSVEGAQFQDRADVAGGVLVVACSAADARLLAADSEYLQENSVMLEAGITHSSAFEMRSFIMFSKSTAIQWKENERWWLPNFKATTVGAPLKINVSARVMKSPGRRFWRSRDRCENDLKPRDDLFFSRWGIERETEV
ncbi:hypothetical protein [Brucella sp. NBRC 12950]|uniref:hypothetical protein n=1 Tax=Brucella sp. NBRC 12950 TaxID=2994518 RepID=UPI00255451D4|nr:hypothetical protein [Brucella sp. NBRC 12950]